MNKAILVGRIAYPPRYNDTNYGAVLNVQVKCSHRYKNNDGEIIEKSQMLKAALWGKLAELNRDVQRGDLISLEGRLQNKKVTDKNGIESWQTEIVCNAFETLVGGEREESSEYRDDQPKQPTPPSRAEQEFSDDDIPF